MLDCIHENHKFYMCKYLSLSGNIVFFVVLLYIFLAFLVYPDYLVDGIVFKLLGICLNTYIYIIPLLLVLLPIEELLVRKLLHKDGFFSIQIKNKYLKYTYNAIFWLGFSCSVLYLCMFLYNYLY